MPARPTRLLVAFATLMLAVGALVYMTDRDASRSMLLPQSAALAGGPLFGTLGQWLPSFVHPLAFALLTAVALPPRATPRYGACVAWCAVNVVFEAGQHPMVRTGLAAALQDHLGANPPVRHLAAYFARGTFDLGDIAAAVAGALVAAGVLHLLHRRRDARHAH